MLAPALASRSPFGHFGEFGRDPLGLLTRAAEVGSDLVRVRMGPWWWTLAATPAAVQHVLQTRASNYRKGFFARSFRPVVGDSLLLSEGDTWLRHRRVAQRAFYRKRLAPLLDVVAETTDAMLGRWEGIAAAEKPVDVAREMTGLTLTITGRILFGVDLTDVPGISALTAHTILCEVGTDVSQFRNASAFASWLGLCPERQISGGKVLYTKSRRVRNRVALALRLGAYSLHHANNYLGEFFRRITRKLGKAQAITATAHKLARIVFHLLSTKQAYDESVFQRCEQDALQRAELRLRRHAERLGFQLVPATIN